MQEMHPENSWKQNKPVFQKKKKKKEVSLAGFAVFIHSTRSDLRWEKHKTF